jgi:hypothetical protein
MKIPNVSTCNILYNYYAFSPSFQFDTILLYPFYSSIYFISPYRRYSLYIFETELELHYEYLTC